MDNETSQNLAVAIEKKNVIVIEYVTPYYHRSLITKRMKQTFKTHLISVLIWEVDSFPEYFGGLLIPEACLEFNMIRACTMNYEHSAHSFVFGTHEFNKITLSPLGCKFIIHNNKFICGSWSNR